jgi:hypothetical protein
VRSGWPERTRFPHGIRFSGLWARGKRPDGPQKPEKRKALLTVKKTGFPGIEEAAPGSTLTKPVERTPYGNLTGGVDVLRLMKHQKRTIGNRMNEQAVFTLGEAAKAVHRSKSTLSKAIKSGRLSYMSREGGEYQIAASELYRVFPTNSNSNSEIERSATLEETGRTAVLQAQLEGMQGELEQVKGERDDLRRRLDAEAEERRKLTALLTDQRQPQQPEPMPAPRKGLRGFLHRLTG